MLNNFGNNTVYKLTVIIVISGKWLCNFVTPVMKFGFTVVEKNLGSGRGLWSVLIHKLPEGQNHIRPKLAGS
jgi:hypothetical protein